MVTMVNSFKETHHHTRDSTNTNIRHMVRRADSHHTPLVTEISGSELLFIWRFSTTNHVNLTVNVSKRRLVFIEPVSSWLVPYQANPDLRGLVKSIQSLDQRPGRPSDPIRLSGTFNRRAPALLPRWWWRRWMMPRGSLSPWRDVRSATPPDADWPAPVAFRTGISCILTGEIRRGVF